MLQLNLKLSTKRNVEKDVIPIIPAHGKGSNNS